MQEFFSITASSYDAESLAPMLTEKSAEGWAVVSIVAAGTNIVAYLSRESADSGSTPSEAGDVSVAASPVAEMPAAAEAPNASVDTPTLPGDDTPYVPAVDAANDSSNAAAVDAANAAANAAAAAEPAGWAAAPDNDIAVLAAQVGADDAAAGTADSGDQAVAATGGVADQAVDAATEAAAAESSVPAGWYADPSGRYELRYWDGSAWTEHVSRAGQQFTDPPVA
ncbi:DUF2510 domain-containing protein [Ilumatobacter sp.]|uniref:DUF2510 domain-containing protein n=1 Tax=Ilumatobacter sp. TaxID=1967498 RepID=UPI003752D600